jgi:hypothetical protein
VKKTGGFCKEHHAYSGFFKDGIFKGDCDKEVPKHIEKPSQSQEAAKKLSVLASLRENKEHEVLPIFQTTISIS